ncbi:hypothetical protein NDU88_007439 [Pleurodeles waltl]|uniref:Uncharacterized protein n=1 Tax=Pleurodeles waltl TaxID=8319 RepID=A0AAV7MGX3_PLEWA|nr:hypothetical protein NDU88_007439 [Pleurodeles waltl]
MCSVLCEKEPVSAEISDPGRGAATGEVSEMRGFGVLCEKEPVSAEISDPGTGDSTGEVSEIRGAEYCVRKSQSVLKYQTQVQVMLQVRCLRSRGCGVLCEKEPVSAEISDAGSATGEVSEIREFALYCVRKSQSVLKYQTQVPVLLQVRCLRSRGCCVLCEKEPVSAEISDPGTGAATGVVSEIQGCGVLCEKDTVSAEISDPGAGAATCEVSEIRGVVYGVRKSQSVLKYQTQVQVLPQVRCLRSRGVVYCVRKSQSVLKYQTQVPVLLQVRCLRSGGCGVLCEKEPVSAEISDPGTGDATDEVSEIRGCGVLCEKEVVSAEISDPGTGAATGEVSEIQGCGVLFEKEPVGAEISDPGTGYATGTGHSTGEVSEIQGCGVLSDKEPITGEISDPGTGAVTGEVSEIRCAVYCVRKSQSVLKYQTQVPVLLQVRCLRSVGCGVLCEKEPVSAEISDPGRDAATGEVSEMRGFGGLCEKEPVSAEISDPGTGDATGEVSEIRGAEYCVRKSQSVLKYQTQVQVMLQVRCLRSRGCGVLCEKEPVSAEISDPGTGAATGEVSEIVLRCTV